MEAKVEGNSRDITNLKDRFDRFEGTCAEHRQDIKEMIEKSLENDLHELKEEVGQLKEQLAANGILVRGKSLVERLSSIDTIINAVIAGVVAIIAAAITSGWRP